MPQLQHRSSRTMYLLIKAGAVIYLTGSPGRLLLGEIMVMELSRLQSNSVALLLVCLFLLRMFYLYLWPTRRTAVWAEAMQTLNQSERVDHASRLGVLHFLSDSWLWVSTMVAKPACGWKQKPHHSISISSFYFLNISGYRLRSEAECVHRYYPNTFSFSNILGGCRVAEASAVDPAAERQLWGRMGRRLWV